MCEVYIDSNMTLQPDGTKHEAEGYHYASGTSMATPYVTGAAALMRVVRPDIPPALIKAILIESVDKYSSLSTLCVSGGRLNAYNAVLQARDHSYIMGDIRNDGRLGADDARYTLRASAKLETLTDLQSALADVNYDGQVTAADARIILRVSAKLQTMAGYWEEFYK